MLLIFASDQVPKKAAEALDDKLLKVQIIESGAVLSTACFLLGIHTEKMYRPDHHTLNPWCIWTSRTKNNFRWMRRYGVELLDEYRFRFRKDHIGENVISSCWEAFKGSQRPIREPLEILPNTTEWGTLDAVMAYRKLLCERKFLSYSQWTDRQKPDWWYKPK